MIKWKDEFSVNIQSIDNQHQRLFEICSAIFDVASLNDGYDHYDEIVGVIKELKEYTEYHFDFEENLLKEYNYPSLENQKFEHLFFIKKLERIERKDIDDDQNEAALEISSFITDWITNHILKSDMQYKTFLNDLGVR